MTKCDFCDLGNPNFCHECYTRSTRQSACISASNAMKNFLKELYNSNIDKGFHVSLTNGIDETKNREVI